MSEQETQQETKQESKKGFGPASLGAMLNEKERKSLLSYIAVGIIIVEFIVTVVAILHGVTNMHQMPDGSMDYSFPWKAYLVSIFLAPIAVMFIIQIVGMGFSRIIVGDPEFNEAVGDQAPEKVRRWINLIQGMPTAIIMAGMLFLGMVLYNIEIVMNFLLKLGETAAELALYGGIALFVAWLISYMARLWVMHKTRKMQEEYAFRREVLEKTGIAIIDEKTAVTADGRMLTAGGGDDHKTIEALPVGGNSTSSGQGMPKSLPVGRVIEDQ